MLLKSRMKRKRERRKVPSLFVTEMSESRDDFGFFVGVRFHRFGTMSTSSKDWSFWQLCLSEGRFFFLFFNVNSRYPFMIDLLELLYGILS